MKDLVEELGVGESLLFALVVALPVDGRLPPVAIVICGRTCNSAKREDTENSKIITGMFSRSFSAIGHQVAVTSFHVPVQRIVANVGFGADKPL